MPKITEKLYIDRLEKMVKRYGKQLCNHCPANPYYTIDYHPLDIDFCKICWTLTAKYANNGISIEGFCPCKFYPDESEDCMLKIAWKVINGWRKDNE